MRVDTSELVEDPVLPEAMEPVVERREEEGEAEASEERSFSFVRRPRRSQ